MEAEIANNGLDSKQCDLRKYRHVLSLSSPVFLTALVLATELGFEDSLTGGMMTVNTIDPARPIISSLVMSGINSPLIWEPET